MDPGGEFEGGGFMSELQIPRGLLVIMDVVNISCNLFLFRYLEEKRRNNAGKENRRQRDATSIDNDIISFEQHRHATTKTAEPGSSKIKVVNIRFLHTAGSG